MRLSSAGHIRGLDGLRAFSVLAVVWHHTHPGYSWLPMSRNGFLGVDVFFVLSGFLITTLMLVERDRTGSLSLKRFYIRRSLRIFPLYYALFAVLAVYFLVLAGPDSSSRAQFLSELPYHLTYTSNWFETESFMAITWSLATEEQFYLLWPPLFIVFGRWVLIPLAAFLVLNQAINFGFLDAQLAQAGIPYVRHEILQATFTPIILGVLAAYALHNSVVKTTLSKWLMRPAALWIFLVLVIAAANIPGDVRGWPRLTFHVCTMLLIMALVLQQGHIVVRLLEIRTVAYVGTISYGIYLLHMVAIDLVSRIGPIGGGFSGETKFLSAWVLSIILAGLSFRFFERPILEFKNRFRAPEVGPRDPKVEANAPRIT
jgi:peptidoglycan/LPS O-acetylase OafA/YrhL